jgi:hypothetical protein
MDDLGIGYSLVNLTQVATYKQSML